MTLYLYMARKFLWTFLSVFGVFLALAMLLDVVEQIRRFESDAIRFSDILQLAMLNMPESLYGILPLIMVLATLWLFLGLARTSELVVIRAAGRSAVKNLIAPVIVAFLLGIIAVAVLNPIVASTKRQYEIVANQFRSGQQSTFSITDEGLWLRQGSATGQTVIRAEGANLNGTQLQKVTFIGFRPDGTPAVRYEAATANLIPGFWELAAVKSWPLVNSTNPERDSELLETLRLPTELTPDKIRDSFGNPNVISVWDLPEFIDNLERAGFSALRHRVWLNMELSLPLMFVAMVMIGSGFTMRHTRFGRTGTMVLGAILLGFSLFFVRDFTQILGENGQIPVALAAWSPPIAAIFLALAILLHFEDG